MELIQASITQAISQYFVTLEGAQAHNIYDLVINQVERPLLVIVMQHANQNQSKAAQWLGISRNTLRKLLAKHNLLT